MKVKKERDRVTIAAEITTDQKKILAELSQKEDRSVSWLIRDALNEYSRKIIGKDLKDITEVKNA